MQTIQSTESLAKNYEASNTLHRIYYFADGHNWLVKQVQIGSIECWQKVREATEFDLAFFADNLFPTTMAEVEAAENEI